MLNRPDKSIRERLTKLETHLTTKPETGNLLCATERETGNETGNVLRNETGNRKHVKQDAGNRKHVRKRRASKLGGDTPHMLWKGMLVQNIPLMRHVPNTAAKQHKRCRSGRMCFYSDALQLSEK